MEEIAVTVNHASSMKQSVKKSDKLSEDTPKTMKPLSESLQMCSWITCTCFFLSVRTWKPYN